MMRLVRSERLMSDDDELDKISEVGVSSPEFVGLMNGDN